MRATIRGKESEVLMNDLIILLVHCLIGATLGITAILVISRVLIRWNRKSMENDLKEYGRLKKINTTASLVLGSKSYDGIYSEKIDRFFEERLYERDHKRR